MSLWDQVTNFFAVTAYQDSKPLQTRSEEGSLEDLLSRATAHALRTSPWRTASIREALGVPAIYRAVSLIANTMGSLSLDAYRQGVKLAADDRPRIIIRPDPFTIPRDFFRDTGWNIATRGEAWWWIASRDGDDVPISVINVPPAEVTVTENPRDLRYPVIEWRGQRMTNADMRQITLNKEPGTLRGVGPLQLCGAAVSVAVEAQEWAANFYADGGYPSVLIKSAIHMTEDEATALKAQWASGANNVPRVVDQGIEDVKTFEPNPQSTSMFEAREYQNADVARMFGVPATLLDTAVAGSSLTYQNLETEFGKFVRGCLIPGYLEPAEQTMSDLLTRATICQFNVDALLRADIKTRFEVYELGVVKSGVLSPEEARIMEGLDPGDIETAPMPLSVPQAVPSSLPIQGRSEMRCTACARLLAIGAGTGTEIRCPRCKLLNVA